MANRTRTPRHSTTRTTRAAERFVASPEDFAPRRKGVGPQSVSELLVAAGLATSTPRKARKPLRKYLCELRESGWVPRQSLIRSLLELDIISKEEVSEDHELTLSR